MNTGAFGENFPYSNFHDLNMDWIIKIAKDFLDQYTHLQETIANGEESLTNLTAEGMEQLQAKATELEGLLQAWYNTHSEDIASQLADALADLNEWYTEHSGYLDQYLADSIQAFNTAADQKAAQTIASIPADYTTFFDTAFVRRGIAHGNTYNGLLLNIDKPGGYLISSMSEFTDGPDGITGAVSLAQFAMSPIFTVQMIFGSGTTTGYVYYRVIRTNNLTVQLPWYRIDMGKDGFIARGIPVASTYSGLIANLITQGGFNLSSISEWSDAPTDASGACFLYNMNNSPVFLTQILIASSTGKAWFRTLRSTTGEIMHTWEAFDNASLDTSLKQIIPFKRGNPSASAYEYSLLNLTDPGGYNVGSLSDWNDAPLYNSNLGCFMFNWEVSNAFRMNILFPYSSPNKIWYRMVRSTTNTVYRDWREITSEINIPNIKILALGDSICKGGRNDNRGFAGILNHTYINMGVGGATISDVRSTYADSIHHFPEADTIPHQLTSYYTRSAEDIQTAFGKEKFTPDVILAEGGINDYINGSVELGTVPTTIVRNDTEAETLDISTLTGALCYLFYQMIKLYPSAQRYFVISHKTGRPNGDYYPTRRNGRHWTQQDMHDIIIECCKLYNVIPIDVYEESVMNTGYPAYRAIAEDWHDASATDYADNDGLHPLQYGYVQGYAPLIRQQLINSTAK